MQNLPVKNVKKNVGFVRKVHKGLLAVGKKYKHTILKDQHYNCKIRHMSRVFIRDYLHSYKWDRAQQQFKNSDWQLQPFSYFEYTDTPTPAQLQWLAGFTEHFSSVKIQYTPKNTRYHPIVRLFYVGSCYPLLAYIAKWYKVKIIQYASGHWGICLTSDNAINLLRAIYPYCVLKQLHYARVIDYYFAYKNNTALFTEFDSFKHYTDNAPVNLFTGFTLPDSAVCNYIGGFYDAKGNATYQYSKKQHFNSQLHMFCQNGDFIDALKESIGQHCGVYLRRVYSTRDNCYALETTNLQRIQTFLTYIVQYCTYKRAYTELLIDWLPVFATAQKHGVRQYYHIADAIKMYWLFLQYGIELNEQNKLF